MRLLAILVAAILGLDLAYLGSPLSLTGRLYTLIIYPTIEKNLELAAEILKLAAIDNLQLKAHVYSSIYFVSLFWLTCFILERLAPRFWCRYLCPAGAVLGFLANFAPWHRKVDAKACKMCAKCTRTCLTANCQKPNTAGLISECLVCGQCARICPKKAISFGLTKKTTNLPDRRTFCHGAMAGLVLTFLARTTSKASFVRPPGSIPETTFLARCLRCGLCMQACPTQWFAASRLRTRLIFGL